MKKTIFALALLVVLSLTACGTSNSAALQQENEDLRQQIAALESENAALDDTAPESGDEESNPIDRFFDGLDVGAPPRKWIWWLTAGQAHGRPSAGMWLHGWRNSFRFRRTRIW